VSVKETSVCVVDDTGKVILEQKVPTEPSDIIALLSSLGATYGRIGIEAGKCPGVRVIGGVCPSFSPAAGLTAWAAKFCKSAICISENGRTSRR
jgi:hypothetical protein